MKRQIVGFIVLVLSFVGLISIIIANSKYIFSTEKYFSESEVEKLREDAYQQSILDNSDKALYDKMSELTLENLKLNNDNAALEQDVDDLQNQIEENKNTIKKLNNQIIELQNIKSDNEIINNNLNLQIDELYSIIYSYENENTRLNSELLEKQTIIENNNKTIDQLQNSISYFEEYIAGLENESEVFAIFVVEDEIFNIQKCNKNGLAYLEEQPLDTENYIFGGWKVNNSKVDLSSYKLTCNTTFVADLTYIYDVNFVVDNVVFNSQKVLHNGFATVPQEPTKELYAFNGWTYLGEIIDLTTFPITSNISFVASFTIVPYGLFDDNGEMLMSWDSMVANNYISVSENKVLKGSNTEKSSLTGRLFIPNEITYIDEEAFYFFDNITEINLHENITHIARGAFAGCKNVSLINFNCISATCADRSQYTFGLVGEYTQSTTLVIGRNVKSICGYMFFGSSPFEIANEETDLFTYINNVIFEDGSQLESIGNSAFAYLPIETLELPNSVVTLEKSAFGCMSKLKTIKLSNSLTSIPNSLFNSCVSLEYVCFPESVTSIGYEVFYYCKSLKSIYIPSSVTSIAVNSSGSGNGLTYYPNFRSNIDIYCGVSSKPSGWKTYWNLFSGSYSVKKTDITSSMLIAPKYGYTVEQYYESIGATA